MRNVSHENRNRDFPNTKKGEPLNRDIRAPIVATRPAHLVFLGARMISQKTVGYGCSVHTSPQRCAQTGTADATVFRMWGRPTALWRAGHVESSMKTRREHMHHHCTVPLFSFQSLPHVFHTEKQSELHRVFCSMLFLAQWVA